MIFAQRPFPSEAWCQMSTGLEETGWLIVVRQFWAQSRSTLGRPQAQSESAILFCQNQKGTVGTGLAAFPDAFDQAGYIKKKKKSGLTNATKREIGSICLLILAGMWYTGYLKEKKKEEKKTLLT